MTGSDGVIDEPALRGLDATASQWCSACAASLHPVIRQSLSLVPDEHSGGVNSILSFVSWIVALKWGQARMEEDDGLLEICRHWVETMHETPVEHAILHTLADSVQRFDLDASLLGHVIDSVEADSRPCRFDTWNDLLERCQHGPRATGRLLGTVLGLSKGEEAGTALDALTTALQLTHYWTSVRSDWLERERFSIPLELHPGDGFFDRCTRTMEQGWGVDQEVLEEFRGVLKEAVDRTWPYYEQAAPLTESLAAPIAPLVEWIWMTGREDLARIESWNYETLLFLPRGGRWTRWARLRHAQRAIRITG